MRRVKGRVIALFGLATALVGFVFAGCVAHEETTPGGYVIAPSVPADGGPFLDASAPDASAR